MTTATKIAELNDAFRTTLIGGRVLMTEGIQSLDDEVKDAIINKVTSFSDFNKDNDPYQEHDFGSFQHEHYKVFWKIDYYDLTFTYASEDPANLKLTRRVMTIMFAEEY